MTSPTQKWHCQTEINPEFFDLDPMNIVWHGNYIKYLEVARCALLRTVGYDYPDMIASGYVWPIIDMRLKYIGSAYLNQPILIDAEIVEWEHRLKINYRISDKATGKVINKAYTIQVAVDAKTNEMCYQSPAILWDCLGVHP